MQGKNRVISIFKRKPKFNNEANQDLAEMLLECSENPILKAKYFEDKKMDYTIESLSHLDDYLEELRSDLPENEELVKITLRSGSYVGEVIRKNSKEKYNWVEFSEAEKLNRQIGEMGFGLGTAAILWAKPDSFVFPLAKVLKRLENGPEDSVVSLAKVAIDGVGR